MNIQIDLYRVLMSDNNSGRLYKRIEDSIAMWEEHLLHAKEYREEDRLLSQQEFRKFIKNKK
jgi:hypothetical protein